MSTSVFILFLALHKVAFSLSKGHFSASRRAFPGFEKGVAQKLTGTVHKSPRNLDPSLVRVILLSP